MEERFLRFKNFGSFPELIHGISNRSYGQMKFGLNQSDDEVVKNRQQFFIELEISADKIVEANQPHSNQVAIVSKLDHGKSIGGADGLITADKDVYLMIKTADCIPVLIYDPAIRKVAVIHASWRAIIDQIIPEVIYKMQNSGSDPENLVVGIGPGICQKHFIVQNSVLKLFLENYPSATLVRNKDGYVDLKKAVLSDLKKAKVHPSNIEIAHFCTVCDNGIYPSFRKEGKGALEIASVIGMKE